MLNQCRNSVGCEKDHDDAIKVQILQNGLGRKSLTTPCSQKKAGEVREQVKELTLATMYKAVQAANRANAGSCEMFQTDFISEPTAPRRLLRT